MAEADYKPGTLSREVGAKEAKQTFFRSISAIERLHFKLHEILGMVLKETPYAEVTPVQALLIYNISDFETTVGGLKTNGFYLGTNVTYNLKKLVKAGYVRQVAKPEDKRAMLVSLSPKGKEVRDLVNQFFNDEIETILDICPLEFSEIRNSLKVTEIWDQFWGMEIERKKR